MGGATFNLSGETNQDLKMLQILGSVSLVVSSISA
jgi:hypothetical protein